MVETREILLRDIFWYIISKWKVLVIVVVAGLLLGGGYSLVQPQNISEEPKKSSSKGFETVESVLQSVEDLPYEEGSIKLYSLLSDADIDTINVYNYYRSLYDSQESFINNSELMKLDPYNSYIGQYLYIIKSSSYEKLDSVLTAYKTKLDELKEKYGTTYSVSSELHDVNAFNKVEAEIDIDVDYNEKPSATLLTMVYGNSQNDCIKKLQEINSHLKTIKDNLDSKVLPHSLEKIVENNYRITDSTILDIQKNSIDTLNSINNSISNIYKSLSVEAQAYIDYLNTNEINYTPFEIDEEINNSDVTDDISNNINTVNERDYKWIIIGALGALIIAIIILIVIYLTSNRIRYEDNFEKLFKVPCFGLTSLYSNRKMPWLDRLIHKARYKNKRIINNTDAVEIIAANIVLSANNNGINKIYATGTFFDESISVFANDISDALKKKGIDMVVGDSLFSCAKEIEIIGELKNIVLFEKTKVSTVSNITKMIKISDGFGVNTLGTVIVG